MRHIRKMLIGSIVFLLVTLVVLKFSDSGIQVEGLFAALQINGTVRMLATDSTLLGGLTGLMSSIIFRNSMNYRTYCWVSIILILVFVELVILTITAL
jgi:hypothetical protein